MKKTIFYAFALVLGLGMLSACSSKEEKADCCSNETETAAQEVGEALETGEPVAVDVEGAQVIDEPDGSQEVQTEVTMTPEQAQ